MNSTDLHSNQELVSRVRKILDLLDSKQAYANSQSVSESPVQHADSVTHNATLVDSKGFEISPIKTGTKAQEISVDQQQLEEALAVVPEEASVVASSHYRHQDSLADQLDKEQH